MYRVREGFDHQRPVPETGANDAPFQGRTRFDVSQIEMSDVLGWIVTSIRLILIMTLAGAVVACAVVAVLPARYTAHTDLLIEPENLKVATNDLFPQRQQSDSQLLDIESKMRVITSGNVLERVVTKLKLVDDPSFGQSWTRIFDMFKTPSPRTVASMSMILSERVKVVRQERSYVVTVSVWAESPQRSVDISNALVDAFEAELNETETREATRIASSLQGRLGGLKDEVVTADAQVETFRAQHGLQKGGGGQLVSSQSLDNFNDKIADLRLQVAQATTRYKDIAVALRAGTDTEALKSPVMTSLRIEQATVNRRVASLASTYGANYPSLIEARSEVRSLERAVAAEHKRLAEAAETEVQRSKTVLSDLEADVASMKKTVAGDDREQIQLRELERMASSKAAVYQTALTRAGEVSERGRLDAVDVRAITDATLPVKPSWPPPRTIVIPAGAFAGLMLGVAIAIALGLARLMRGRQDFGFAA